MRLSELEITKISKSAEDPTELFTDNGWTILGSGVEAAVAEHPNKSYVLKLFPNVSKYPVFVEYVQNHQNNPHLPKFSRFVRPVPGSIWQYVRMEKLSPCIKIELQNSHMPELMCIQAICNSYKMRSGDPLYSETIDDFFAKYTNKYAKTHFRITDITMEHVGEICDLASMPYPDTAWISLIEDLCKLSKKTGILLDIHDENVMLRDNILVVTDPFYGG